MGGTGFAQVDSHDGPWLTLSPVNGTAWMAVYSCPNLQGVTPLFIHRIVLAAMLSLLSACAQARDYRYSDAHLHYVDFFQESEGMTSLLEAMAAGRIDHVLISGIPVAKKWHEDEPKRPRYYAGDDAGAYWYSATDVLVADAVKRLPAEQRERFHPFLSGFNPNDKNSDAHIRRMLELDPGLWQGIGEVFTRHDDLTALTYGETPRANNEAMTRVYHLAAEYDLPVLLHSNITSKRERNPLYLAEIEEPLRNHPHVRFIWAHAGTSMEIHRHQEKLDFLLPTLERLLGEYPNLYVDLSWSVLQPYLLDTDGKPDARWVELVSRYPARFMLGSDVVGKFDGLGEAMQAFAPFLDALPETVARSVARDNFLAVLPRQRQAAVRD
ncbi:Amidohydrolase [Aquipseudomonas alcaligenes]|uniref:Amidohydrolase n=2 Tax=Aquipseudomonas alcaligenes TaxID=43263 RepID=A0A1N6WZJ1_AQUAC|nr:Amidohydrolase [Pseudomonas alcaligenes]